MYKDFAHSPSKLKATVTAMHEQYPMRTLIAVMELHTFSSLNSEFLSQYEGAMNNADVPVVYFDRETFAHKKMDVLSEEEVKDAFGNHRLHIFTDRASLESFLLQQSWNNANLLLMTSGNFSGMNIDEFSAKILNK